MYFRHCLTLALASLLATPALADVALETKRDKALYSIGAAIGRQFQGLDLSPEEYERVAIGLRDAALSRHILASMVEFQEEVVALQEERRQRAIERDRQRSLAFLAEVASRDGVVKTESGLLFESLSPGSGPSPGPSDRVKVHYRGQLRDGELFDSTRVRKAAASFPLEAVIPCWTEGLQHMRVGGRARIVCPPTLGYGPSGYPPNVPPNAPLDFEVELLAIEP